MAKTAPSPSKYWVFARRDCTGSSISRFRATTRQANMMGADPWPKLTPTSMVKLRFPWGSNLLTKMMRHNLKKSKTCRDTKVGSHERS